MGLRMENRGQRGGGYKNPIQRRKLPKKEGIGHFADLRGTLMHTMSEFRYLNINKPMSILFNPQKIKSKVNFICHTDFIKEIFRTTAFIQM